MVKNHENEFLYHVVELALTRKRTVFGGLGEPESPASDNGAKWWKIIFVKHGGTCSGLHTTEYI